VRTWAAGVVSSVALAALAAGCGGGSTSASTATTSSAAIVPNVVGATMTDAVEQLVDARVCVTLRLDRKLPPSRVASQSPRFGASVKPWTPVTIVVGLPQHKPRAFRVTVTVKLRGTHHPCPPIRAVARLPRKP
jgi:hypothetical protein